MVLWPSQTQLTALLLSIAFPGILFCCRRISGTGRRFQIAAGAIVIVYSAVCFALAGTLADILSGALILGGALMFWCLGIHTYDAHFNC